MLIWLAGMKYAKVSIASALNQTSTIFVLLFAALILKERITLRKVAAIILAVAGAILVFIA
jgi:drug/metabolite transporter (DMT)-like permease